MSPLESELKLSVIINNGHPESWLDKALTGFALQTWRDFEVIVADAGASTATAELIAGRRHGYPVPLRHVSPGGGGGASVLDQAIQLAAHEYLLFTDGDCIPRRDVVAAHVELAERGRFLTGNCCSLGPELSRLISRNDIVRGRCFDLDWLQLHEPLSAPDRRKLGASPAAVRLLERVTAAGADFDCRNASAWRSDLLAATDGGRRPVVGTRGQGLDRRLAIRGVRGKRIRDRGVCLQLEPGRPPAPRAVANAVAGSARAAAQCLPSRAPWAM